MRRPSAFITTRVFDHLMKFLKIFAFAVTLLTTAQAVQKPSAHTKGTATGKPTGRLKPASIGGNRSSGGAVRSWCS
jgi:hypothetical protein